MKTPKHYIIILLCFLFNCCLATTKIASYKNPDYANKSYTVVMVFADDQDLLRAQEVENAFQKNFKQTDIYYTYKRTDLFSPAKSYSKNEIQQIILKNKIETVLVVSLLDEYKDYSVAPVRYNGVTTMYGNQAYTSGSTSGGEILPMLRQKYNISLIDLKTSEIIWKTSSFTAGNDFAVRKTLLNSLASKVAIELRNQGLLTKTVVKTVVTTVKSNKK